MWAHTVSLQPGCFLCFKYLKTVDKAYVGSTHWAFCRTKARQFPGTACDSFCDFFWQGLDNQFSNLNSGLAKNSAWVSPKPICETNGWKLGIHYFNNSAELIRWTCVMGGTEGWSERLCLLLGQCGGKMILFHNTSCSLRFQLCKSIITGAFSYKTKYLAPGPPGRQTVIATKITKHHCVFQSIPGLFHLFALVSFRLYNTKY